MKKSQTGFVMFEAIVIAGVVAIVALAGWNIYRTNQKNGSTAVTRVSQTISVAPSINSASDLDKAAATLDKTSVDDTAYLNQLDKQLSSF